MLSSLSILQQFASPKLLIDLATIYGQRQLHNIGSNPPGAVPSSDWPNRGQFPLPNSQFISQSSPPSDRKLRIISEEEGEEEEEEKGKEGGDDNYLPDSVAFEELEEEGRGGGKGKKGEEEEEEGENNNSPVNVIELEEENKAEDRGKLAKGQSGWPPLSASAIESKNIGTGGGEEGGRNGRRNAAAGSAHAPQYSQLSPAASICAEVQRVSIEDRPITSGDEGAEGEQPSVGHQQAKKSSPESGRLERAGRALRKHAAVEDEEHLLGPLDPQAPSSSHHPLVVPALHISPLAMLAPSHSQQAPPSIPSVSPLIAAEQHLAFAAAAAAAASRPSTTASSQLDSSTAAAIQLALLQQCHRPPQMAPMGVKHEPMSREELLSNLQQQANREQLLAAANCPPWLVGGTAAVANQQQQQQTIGMGNALLNALIQQQQNAAESVVPNRTAESALLIETRGLAAIQEEHLHHPPQSQQHTADIAHLFEAGRNHSTESTASTSGGSLPSGATAGIGADSIPRKQDIQTDIRMNRGRFQLVRKRGRSEVWNLFGQVVDTLTGARLPYVACYACKVLYTDTGGGTGNMTRHRCSMGSSYRSAVRRSSSDTTVGNESLSINQSSSFESIGGAAMGQSGGSFGATSPPYEGQSAAQMLLAAVGGANVPSGQQSQEAQGKVWNVTAGAREAFAQSGSSGFLSAGSTTSSSMPFGISASSTSMDSSSITAHPHYQQLSINLGPSPSSASVLGPPFLGGSASAGPSTALMSPSASLHPPHQGLLSALSPSPAISSSSLAPSASSAPSSILLRPLLAQGHHFTAADKQIFAQAVMQFCAQDMHNWDVVEGEGFKNLVETILFIGRRSHGDPSANTYDPVRQLIPSARQLKQVFTTQEGAVLKATARDLEQVKDVGLALNCQTLEFAGERHYSISVNYLSDDWRIARRCLKVERVQKDRNLDKIVDEVIAQFNLTTKLILITMDPFIEEMKESENQNMHVKSTLQPLANANRALNKILAKSLAECPDSAQIMTLIRICSRIISIISSIDRCDRFPQSDFLGRTQHGGGELSSLDFTNWVYPAIKFIKEKFAEIQVFLNVEGMTAEEESLKSINCQMLTELELFLEPFHETAQIFTDSKQPHFQRILPEWFALIHECQSGQQSLDEPTSNITSGADDSAVMDTTTASAAINIASGTPNWIRLVRKVANQHLKEWAQTNIRLEHRAATVLNPRLRHLPLICSDHERAAVHERIRELIGLSKPKRDNGGGDVGVGMKSEPFKKRRRFLDRLEDCAMEEEDELDLYLRTTFAPSQTRDILEFWSSIGEIQFPRLSRLARFLLATSGAPSPVRMQQRSAGILEPNQIGTLLNLRPEVLNSVNQQLAHHRVQRHQHIEIHQP